MGAVVWAIIAVAIVWFLWWANRQLAHDGSDDRFDPGLAILEFGRAFPNEAIRQVILTADGRLIFLRLWNGQAGCMRPMGGRYQCQLLKPAGVIVTPAESPNGLVIDFPGSGFPGGRFEFRSAQEASEVALWLLGSLALGIDDEHQISPT